MAYYSAIQTNHPGQHQRQHHQQVTAAFNQIQTALGYNNTNNGYYPTNTTNGIRPMMQQRMPHQVYNPRATAISNNTSLTPGNTLELKVVTLNMAPGFASSHAPHLAPTMNQLFQTLPKEDAALLRLVEVFTFFSRPKLPQEPAVMPNACLYFTKLTAAKSRLSHRLTEVTGFRCSCCRHTTLSAPNGYMVGAAQLVSTEKFIPPAIYQSLSQLRGHMLNCTFIGPDVKAGLKKLAHRPTVGMQYSSLEDYLTVWCQGIEQFSKVYGYPKLMQKSTIDPSVGVLQQALASTQQGYRAFNNTPPPLAPLPDEEDVVHWELEESVRTGLAGNNYGVARVKPRTIVANLSQLPIANSQHAVAPLLELLLQSMCAIQRWRTPTTLAKGTTAPPPEKQHLSNIFFECNYCRGNAFCASTANPRDAADFILTVATQHLCGGECDQVPTSLEEKLTKMGTTMTEGQRYKQRTIILENFNAWKSTFPDNTRGPLRSSKRLVHSKFWRPLDWKFIEEKGGACIADDTLANEDTSVFWEVRDDKRLPYATRDNDVLFGWNGKHLGNRRFLNLLALARTACYEGEGVSVTQQKIVACEVMRAIGKQGGAFFQVNPNPLMPPTLCPPKKAVHLVFSTLKDGNFVLYRKPTDPSKRGRGSRVIECERAPQRTLYGKEIVFDKPFKKSVLE